MLVMAAAVGLTLKGYGRKPTLKGHAATSCARGAGETRATPRQTFGPMADS